MDLRAVIILKLTSCIIITLVLYFLGIRQLKYKASKTKRLLKYTFKKKTKDDIDDSVYRYKLSENPSKIEPTTRLHSSIEAIKTRSNYKKLLNGNKVYIKYLKQIKLLKLITLLIVFVFSISIVKDIRGITNCKSSTGTIKFEVVRALQLNQPYSYILEDYKSDRLDIICTEDQLDKSLKLINLNFRYINSIGCYYDWEDKLYLETEKGRVYESYADIVDN